MEHTDLEISYFNTVIIWSYIRFYIRLALKKQWYSIVCYNIDIWHNI